MSRTISQPPATTAQHVSNEPEVSAEQASNAGTALLLITNDEQSASRNGIQHTQDSDDDDSDEDTDDTNTGAGDAKPEIV